MALTKVRGGGVDNPLTLGGGSASDRSIIFDGNAQDFHIGLDDSTDSLTFGLGSTLGTNSHIVVNSSGQITNPSVPAFLARFNGASVNLNGEDWVFNSTSINDGYNNGSHYSTSNGRFTAPVAGRYNIHFSTIVSTQGTNMTFQLRKNGSTFDQLHFSQDESGWNTYSFGGVYNLAENDYVTVYVQGNYTVYGQTWSRFTGCLVG
jgi:hypothetical protein